MINFEALSAFLDQVAEGGLPTYELIIKQDGKEIFRKKGGAVNAPADGALYFMYSATKPITIAAALKLIEDGRLSLDDPVTKFLPEFADLKVEEADGSLRPAKGVITIKNLMQMMSGFSYKHPSEVAERIKKKTGGRCDTVSAVREFVSIPLCSDPGTRFCYGLSHDILAAVCAVVSGMSFRDYVGKVIFAPLGMNDSYWYVNDEILGRMETQYAYNGQMNKILPKSKKNGYILGPEYDSGGAGIISTADDMETFLEALANFGLGANGNRILKPETVELMRSTKVPRENLDDFVNHCFGNGYTYALGVRSCDVVPNESGSPLGEFGWSGAAGSFQIICPEKNLSAFFATHVLGGYVGKFRKDLFRMILE